MPAGGPFSRKQCCLRGADPKFPLNSERGQTCYATMRLVAQGRAKLRDEDEGSTSLITMLALRVTLIPATSFSCRRFSFRVLASFTARRLRISPSLIYSCIQPRRLFSPFAPRESLMTGTREPSACTVKDARWRRQDGKVKSVLTEAGRTDIFFIVHANTMSDSRNWVSFVLREISCAVSVCRDTIRYS